MSIRIGIGIDNARYDGTTYVGILDQYPNAAVAYSFRKLRAAYSGNAIRVRRSGDNAESDFGFVNNAISLTAIQDFCIAGGGAQNGFLVTWYDQSGNGNNATQATASRQGTIVLSGVFQQDNSKPCLNLDGSDDRILLNTAINSLDMTIATILNRDSTASPNYSSLFGQGSFNGFYNNPATGGWAYRTAVLNNLVGIPPSPNNQQIQLFLNVSATQSNGYYNNIAGIVGQSITNPGYSLRELFYDWAGGSTFKGKAQEFIAWNSNQMSNRSGISSNINNYYGTY